MLHRLGGQSRYHSEVDIYMWRSCGTGAFGKHEFLQFLKAEGSALWNAESTLVGMGRVGGVGVIHRGYPHVTM